jgi:hypothetical protein
MATRHSLGFVVLIFALCASGCGTTTEPGGGSAAVDERTVRSGALSLDVPAGWHGSDAEAEGPSAPTLRVATFPLSPRPTDQGQQEQTKMGDQDILISVVDYGLLPAPDKLKELSAVDLPITVARSDLGSFEGFRDAVATRAFVVNGHAIQLWVVFGSSDAGADVFDQANQALETLAVTPTS